MILFCISASLLAWNLAGYPILLFVIANRKKDFVQFRKKTIRDVSVLVAAHNEETCIKERVENLKANGSWRNVEIIVVSDGSTDKTAELAEKAGAHVIEKERAGKISALYKAISESKGEALVVTDANTIFLPGAIDLLVDPLEDTRVGITAGDLILENDDETASSRGESIYWKYETWIKRNASNAGLLLMGAGGIYAVRKENWPMNIPADTADDSYVPLSLHKNGFMNIFVPEARAKERAGTLMKEEWNRRIRMVAQDTKVAAALSFGLPNKKTFFALVSQKVLRWLILPLAVIFLITSRDAAKKLERMKGIIRLAHLHLKAALPITGAIIMAGAIAERRGKKISGVSVAFYFFGAATAAFAGLIFGMLGKSNAIWNKADSTRKTNGVNLNLLQQHNGLPHSHPLLKEEATNGY